MPKNLLLEIGTEEIPSSYIDPAIKQLHDLIKNALESKMVAYKDIKMLGTPRRLSLLIEKLNEKSQDRNEEHLGPTLKIGKDKNGNFTAAALGFASKHNVNADNLVVKKTEKGEYLCVRKNIPGEKSENILRLILPEIISKISFPKSMVWEPSNFKFARPIRTIIALYGDKVIKFSIAQVKTSNFTYGLHTISSKKITISSADRYVSSLRNNCVLIDQKERKTILKKIIETSAKRVKGNALIEESLLDEVNYLVEHPVAILGNFDEKYLKLPQEILINCMQKKQKYFPIADNKGRLINSFIGIRNGISENQNIVKEGYERVLSARLADAEFFFHQDTRIKLINKVEKLKGVIFHEKLGTIYEKIVRIKQIAGYINDLMEDKVESSNLEKACELSKADLVTEMVFEYPELQGTIGRIYSEVYDEDKNISKSIEEHYWPLTSESKLPESNMGKIVSLSDKIDTLVADFTIGCIPSGSADPYGLRRIAIGILRIIKENKLPIKLKGIIDKAFSCLPQNLQKNIMAKDQVSDFFRQRLENILENDGYKFDEVRAILTCGFEDLSDVEMRLKALKDIRKMPDFEPLATAFKRSANILKQAKKNNITIPATVNEALLKEETEKILYNNAKKIESEVKSALNNKEYIEVMKKMVSLKPDVDNFFDKVMVMVDDVDLRSNRLALLNYIKSIFFNILDFSLLQ
ncbi:MAG: glycine--tRNA ligase subunit beta [Endomicrobiales bacterium]|nr:glycine--tRNA ligase subunit beta [Endomicrobiales bacterium]